MTVSFTWSVAVNAILPLASVTLGLGPTMIECPFPCDSAICLPGVGRWSASWSVTVMVTVDVPSAVTEDWSATIDAAAADGTTKGRVRAGELHAVGHVHGREGDGLRRQVLHREDDRPVESDTPLAGEMVTWLPGFAARVTVLPSTVWWLASSSVTRT